MKIIFHGANASTFYPGFADLLNGQHDLIQLPDALTEPSDQKVYQAADVIIGIKFNGDLPKPASLKLYQVPGAGYDGIATAELSDSTYLCNCFGHEVAIAEYAMAALLSRHVPLVDADQRLRKGDWKYWAGGPSGVRTELGSTRIGIIGYGHIGKEIARRAKAFGMTVHAANRSAINDPAVVDQSYALSDFGKMLPHVDVVVNTLPLATGTVGLIGSEAFAQMQAHAVFMNVGRGGVVDEDALYQALKNNQIAHAFIDTWYIYPNAPTAMTQPAHNPFQDLSNITMTPHMSGWTHGTIARRKQAMADNINLIAQGQEPINQVAK